MIMCSRSGKAKKFKSVKEYEYLGENQEILNVTSFLFDEGGRLIQVITDHHSGVRESLEYSYDNGGKIIKKKETGTDGKVLLCRYEYDDEGNIIREELTDVEGNHICYGYYNWIKPDRVLSYERIGDNCPQIPYRKYNRKDGKPAFIQAKDFFVQYEYDGEGNQICEKVGRVPIGKKEPEWYSIHRYNKEGLAVGYTNEEGINCSMEYEYDKNGNWIRMEGRIENGPVSKVVIREITLL